MDVWICGRNDDNDDDAKVDECISLRGIIFTHPIDHQIRLFDVIGRNGIEKLLRQVDK